MKKKETKVNSSATLNEPITTKKSNVDGSKLDQQTIQGILTSRIEKRNTNEPYYYGFFKFPNQELEIPVIWKEKPIITKGDEVLLTGSWANSNNSDRPSFTCHAYEIITNPPPLTTKSLREQIQPLITTSLDKKTEWTQRTDFLFRKLDELKKIEELSKSGNEYLQAYLLLKNLDYSASHDGKLTLENFTQERYLERIQTELENTEKRVSVYQNLAHKALDSFADKTISIISKALAEKDQIITHLKSQVNDLDYLLNAGTSELRREIGKLRRKLANCACQKEVNHD